MSRLPALSVEALHDWLEDKSAYKPVILDVRERWETDLGHIKDSHLHPLSALNEQVINEVPKTSPVVVVCHHGIRSAMVTEWLINQGYTDVLNLEGGINAWSLRIDPSIELY